MNHAIIVEESLANKQVLKYFAILHTKEGKSYKMHVIDVINPDEYVRRIQKAMKANKPYYFHVYNNGFSMMIVYKNQVFRVNPNNKNTWLKAIKYGQDLGIPRDQLDFYPTRIAEEKEWLR
ncbi:MAG: hypothetical protein HW405_657 [Candidatus Berkelbacteria bacterium]|nr:hypothetical protein [Candidatus Berkelbacteria bacterium]